MRAVTLEAPNDLAGWRDAARPLLAAGIAPETLVWQVAGATPSLFGHGDGVSPDAVAPESGQPRPLVVPRRFVDLAEAAICHAGADRFGLLYRIAFRLQDQRGLPDIASDPDWVTLERHASAVRRESHKMKAFVRFRRVPDRDGEDAYAAWFEPEHFTLERTAPFFARRFAAMRWTILTPYRSVAWTGTALAFGPGATRAQAPGEDALEDAWRTYFAAIFNPARLKVAAMAAEMPKKYWRNLPEAESISSLIRSARLREHTMITQPPTEPPPRHRRQAARHGAKAPSEATPGLDSLAAARAAIEACRRCPLHENATQAVFGEGPARADIMFVGEQPGDQEDLAGRPFVGPAGKMFDAVLAEIGLDRRKVYVTNAVKHFKFVPRGKRRLHQKPYGGEIAACRFWLDEERALVAPKILVALGASAAQALLGKTVTIARSRGAPIALEDGTTLFVTVHPSYLLRIPEPERAKAERARFAADLAAIRAYAEGDAGKAETPDPDEAG